MKSQQLIERLTGLGKTAFTIGELAKLFPAETNLKTSLYRLRVRGIILPVGRGIYRLADQPIDVEELATQAYYPSYVSLETVLGKYGVINQGFNAITLMTTRHTKKMKMAGIPIHYFQIKPELFFGFKLIGKSYVADVEKALLDEIYLMSLRKRVINTQEWSFESINKDIFNNYAQRYPLFTQRFAEKIVKF